MASHRAAAPELISEPAAILADPSLAGGFVGALAQAGAESLVANAACHAMVLRQGAHALPVLVEDGGYGRSYVTAPHSAYVLYARDEMDIVELRGAARWSAHATLAVMDRLLRTIRLNRAVQLDNWLLSTNLHGRWNGEGLPAMRALLTEHFPDHFVILRSLDPWSCPELLGAARRDGWALLPARQVWVTDDLERDWRPRNHAASDRRKLRQSQLVVEDPDEVSPRDAARIAELYRQLYLGRYSAMNPAYTPRFIALSAQLGLLRFRVARDSTGLIMAFTAMRIAGDILTTPLIGYDLTRPQSEGLYRIASYLAAQWAHERGLRHHGSSGAGVFKSNRGAKGVIEYMAVYGGHLSRPRRAGLGVLASGLESLMVPMLKRQQW
jgi:hypothetical protein